MSLSGQQRKKLQKALIDAFPDQASLERMLWFELEINLDAIAEGSNLEAVVFNLIKLADSQGWIEKLVASASKSNPGNSSLQAITEDILRKTNNRKFQKLQQKDRIRNELINTISIKINDLLYSFLPKAKQINLLKQSRPDLLWRTSTEKLNPSRRSNPYPLLEKNIIDIFFESKGRLLIIGEPGSGKTITLLELAKYLIDKAKEDSNEPIPVRFSLSSWDNQNIEEWLVSELKKYYNVTTEEASNLLKNYQLIPLLDDLDQVDRSRQSKCVQAINKFMCSQFRPDYLIVCSCEDEYKSNTYLKLNGAIYLHPLTEVQIHNYLVYIGRSKLWTYIQDSPNILELIKNPLFLSIMLMLEEEISTLQIWTNFYSDKSESLRYLFNKYIDQRLEQYSLIKSKKAKIWLNKIAINLKSTKNNYLLIETIQPNDWLASNNKKNIYNSMIALIMGVITYPFIILICYTHLDYIRESLGEGYPLLDSVFRLILLPILSILLGFTISLLNPEIKPVETIKMPLKEIVFAVKYANLKDRMLGAVIANIRNFIERIDNLIPISFFWQTSSITYFLQTSIAGIIGALMAPTVTLRESIRGLRGEILDIKDRKIVNQGIKNSAINGFFIALIYGLLLFLIGCLFGLLGLLGSEKTIKADAWLSFGQSVGLLGMLFGGLFGGLLACIQHFTLRIIIASHGDMPWRYVRFLNYATKQRFLQREGGRYRFIHPLMQKHFTTIDID